MTRLRRDGTKLRLVPTYYKRRWGRGLSRVQISDAPLLQLAP
jgi:hypothetical protein